MADKRETSREGSPVAERGRLGDSPREDDRRRVSSRDRGERGPSREYRDKSRDRDGERERGRDSRDRDVDRREPRDSERERGRGERDRDMDRDRDADRRRGDRYDDRRRRSRSGDRDYRRRSRSRSRGRYDYSPPRRRDDREWRGGGDREWRGGGGGRGRRGGRMDDSEEEAYGGYRPRRRQDPNKSDKPLPPGAGPGSIQDPFYYLRQNVPTDPAEAQRLWLEQQLKSRQMVLQQQAVSAAAASAKTQRELYIGNLVPGAVTDVALRQLFNATLLAAFPPTAPGEPDPVAGVNLHSEGRYAFVEFRSPEMATAALALNNQVQLLGQTISVGRPSGYVDPSKAATAATAAAAALDAFQKGDMEQLAQHAAAAGMNLAQLGLATLMLQAKSGAAAAAAAAAAGTAGVAGAPAAGAAGAGEQLPPPPLPGNGAAAVAAVAAAIGHGQPEAEAGAGASGDGAGAGEAEVSPYLEVDGMLSADLLVDDEEYESVIEDLRDECDRHTPGGVLAVKVPRPPPLLRAAGGFMGTGHFGKAFVSFRDPLAAQRAHAAIHGRLFAGSTVRAAHISAEQYGAVPDN